jgi:hypothetical protein
MESKQGQRKRAREEPSATIGSTAPVSGTGGVKAARESLLGRGATQARINYGSLVVTADDTATELLLGLHRSTNNRLLATDGVLDNRHFFVNSEYNELLKEKFQRLMAVSMGAPDSAASEST